MVLHRVRESASRALSHPCLRRWTPVGLLIVTAAYIFLGGTAYYFLENARQEASVRRWYMSAGVTRRYFAREISTRIFNDTRNLLIIIDREQTERVQQLLVESLLRYEGKVNVAPPDKKSWSLLNSINYAYSLLLTVGQGTKLPVSFWGQVLTVPYVLIGVPLFMATIGACVHQFLLPLLVLDQAAFTRRLIVMILGVILYVAWGVAVALCLYFKAFEEFLPALLTGLLSVFTVQITSPLLNPCEVLVLLLLSTVSLAIAFLVGFLFMSCYGGCGIPVKTEEHDDDAATTSTQRFTVVVDQAGDSKLSHDTD